MIAQSRLLPASDIGPAVGNTTAEEKRELFFKDHRSTIRFFPALGLPGERRAVSTRYNSAGGVCRMPRRSPANHCDWGDSRFARHCLANLLPVGREGRIASSAGGFAWKTRTLSAWSVTSNATIAALTALWGLLACITSPRTAIAIAGILILATPFLLPRHDYVPQCGREPARSPHDTPQLATDS